MIFKSYQVPIINSNMTFKSYQVPIYIYILKDLFIFFEKIGSLPKWLQ